MKKKHYKTVFISDIHLGNPKNQSDKLIKFLDSISFENLIIIGDFIDYRRLKRFGKRGEKEQTTLNYINNLTNSGVNITYIQGNHDRQLKCSEKIHFNNITICKNTYHTTIKGKTYFITHGDSLMSGLSNSDFIGILWTILCSLSLKFENNLNKHTNKKFNISPSEIINKYIKLALFSPKKTKKKTNKFLKQLDCDGAIIGHFHNPQHYSLNGIDYFNTGDWINNCSAITENLEGNLELIRYKYSE